MKSLKDKLVKSGRITRDEPKPLTETLAILLGEVIRMEKIVRDDFNSKTAKIWADAHFNRWSSHLIAFRSLCGMMGYQPYDYYPPKKPTREENETLP